MQYNYNTTTVVVVAMAAAVPVKVDKQSNTVMTNKKDEQSSSHSY